MLSILVHAEDSPAGQVRRESGFSLARMTGGHCTLLVDTPITRYIAVDAMGGGAVATEAMREAVAEDDAFAREIEAHCARGDVPCSVVRAEAETVEALADAARLADVTIVSRGTAVASDLPMAIRGPVLAVNGDKPLCFPLAKVVIAWDGSAEAAHALRSAAPLLKGAEVVVLTVQDGAGSLPATDALSYLSRHGISAEFHVLERVGAVEETLAREVGLLGAELLVMGAYSHSRLREFLFGGVTRYFLEYSDGPALLLAH